MYWSEKYTAYACFVDADKTGASLNGKLSVVDNPVVRIDCSGDLDGNGTVTPADSAAINANLLQPGGTPPGRRRLRF